MFLSSMSEAGLMSPPLPSLRSIRSLPLNYAFTTRPSLKAQPDVARLQEQLEDITVTDMLATLPDKQPLFTISASASLSNAISVLHEHSLLSAPIIADDGSCVGFLDTIAALSYYSKAYRSCTGSATTTVHAKQGGICPTDGSVFPDGRALCPCNPLSQFLPEPYFQRDNNARVIPFFLDNPVMLLVDALSHDNHVRRAALISRSLEITGVCSQTDLLTLLQRQLSTGRYAHLTQLPMKSVVKRTEIQAASETTTVNDAIEALAMSGYSSLAVVDNNSGALIAEVSAASLGAITDMDQLEDSLLDFLMDNAPAALRPVTTTETDHWGSAVESMTKQGAHRAWMIDDRGRPLAVLSLTDICRVLSTGRHITPMQANGEVKLRRLWVAPPLSSPTNAMPSDHAGAGSVSVTNGA